MYLRGKNAHGVESRNLDDQLTFGSFETRLAFKEIFYTNSFIEFIYSLTNRVSVIRQRSPDDGCKILST